MFTTPQKGFLLPHAFQAVEVQGGVCTGFPWDLVMLLIQKGVGHEAAQEQLWSHRG